MNLSYELYDYITDREVFEPTMLNLADQGRLEEAENTLSPDNVEGQDDDISIEFTG